MSKIPPSKYQRWYDALCHKARNREIPTAYTEVHHIKPRSMGGSDDPSNLVRLTYREHFICHMLLVRMTIGPDQRKMKKALGAMGLKSSGQRTASGWQVELAKRTVRDLELDDEAQKASDRRRRNKRNAEKLALIEEQKRQEAEYWSKLIEMTKTMFSPEMLEKILAQKARRDADIKKYGWYYVYCPAVRFESF
jgi:hypothetical protein